MFKSLEQKLTTAKAKLAHMINRKASRRLIASQIITVERLEYQIEKELMTLPMLGAGRVHNWARHLRNERIRNREGLSLETLTRYLSSPYTQNPDVWVSQKDLPQNEWEIKIDAIFFLPSLMGSSAQYNWAIIERIKRLMGLPVDQIGDFLELSQMVMARSCDFWLDTRFLSVENFCKKLAQCMQGYHGFAHELRKVG